MLNPARFTTFATTAAKRDTCPAIREQETDRHAWIVSSSSSRNSLRGEAGNRRLIEQFEVETLCAFRIIHAAWPLI